MKNPYLRIISDVRSDIDSYLPLLEQPEYTLQLGNLSSVHYKFFKDIDPVYHKAIAGSQEVYDPQSEYYFRKIPNFLKDYGIWKIPNFDDIFYVRGGASVNKKKKQSIGNWWSEEECSIADLTAAIEYYSYLKPKFVVTHECPSRVLRYVSNRTKIKTGVKICLENKTNKALNLMFRRHKPDVWIFGSYHKYFSKFIEGTHFICLNEVPNRWCFLDFPRTYKSDLVTAEELDLIDHQDPTYPFELDLGGGG